MPELGDDDRGATPRGSRCGGNLYEPDELAAIRARRAGEATG
jgi:hypothetical protein